MLLVFASASLGRYVDASALFWQLLSFLAESIAHQLRFLRSMLSRKTTSSVDT